ncbi:NADH dehydrogenase ubiquinone Fe-S protein 4 [Phenylobacterium sp.]|uniref:NADH dehydrogenase ubiquinone Fe-S protein 4 n=1 Tax=Phenylobacterium sp. TaxID=1871053 RepID=UPI002E34469D|nr:NADH dehydrogenase ubiquinone Fe-S protein 4 [Phenylobacterium sp.]HEX2561526.1 NADH dehydrogenase ubiquinone Fe-S protein 4 [Phenylobacterium sp.]
MLGHNLSRARPTLPGTSSPADGPVPLARIRQETPSATESAPQAGAWVLEFEPVAPSRLDPLTGWTVTTDPFSQIRMRFPDMQSAIAFAERKGWTYVVAEGGARRMTPKRPPSAAHVPWDRIWRRPAAEASEGG